MCARTGLRAVARVNPVVAATGFRGVLSRQASGAAAAAKMPDTSLLVEMTPAELAAKDAKPALPMRTITMVKKLLPDGSACRKCNEIQQRLKDDGLEQHIDDVLYMDPSAPGTDRGTQLAIQHSVKTAPFFVVRTEDADNDAREDVYVAYLKMKKNVFGRKTTIAEADNDVAMSIF
jgi:hypothetical protein